MVTQFENKDSLPLYTIHGPFHVERNRLFHQKDIQQRNVAIIKHYYKSCELLQNVALIPKVLTTLVADYARIAQATMPRFSRPWFGETTEVRYGYISHIYRGSSSSSISYKLLCLSDNESPDTCTITDNSDYHKVHIYRPDCSDDCKCVSGKQALTAFRYCGGTPTDCDFRRRFKDPRWHVGAVIRLVVNVHDQGFYGARAFLIENSHAQLVTDRNASERLFEQHQRTIFEFRKWKDSMHVHAGCCTLTKRCQDNDFSGIPKVILTPRGIEEAGRAYGVLRAGRPRAVKAIDKPLRASLGKGSHSAKRRFGFSEDNNQRPFKRFR